MRRGIAALGFGSDSPPGACSGNCTRDHFRWRHNGDPPDPGRTTLAFHAGPDVHRDRDTGVAVNVSFRSTRPTYRILPILPGNATPTDHYGARKLSALVRRLTRHVFTSWKKPSQFSGTARHKAVTGCSRSVPPSHSLKHADHWLTPTPRRDDLWQQGVVPVPSSSDGRQKSCHFYAFRRPSALRSDQL